MFDKKKQLMWSKLKVGIVFTAALFILFGTVFFAGGIEEILTPKVRIKAQLKDVRGLRKGAPVWVSGIEVGSVRSIDLSKKYGTVVTMAVNGDAIKFVKKDSKASVLTMGLLGDKYVEISAGSADAEVVKPGDIIEGGAQLEIQDIVNASLVSLTTINEFIKELEGVIEKFERSEGTLAKFLKDPSIYDNLKETTESLSALLRRFEKSEGSLKMFVEDPTLYHRLSRTTASLEEFSSKLASESGTLRRLVEDPELYENMDNASAQITSILTRIEQSKGLAWSLVNDEELASEFRDTLDQLRSSLKEFNELVAEIKQRPKKYFKFSIF
ncbi:MAG: MlaD family protein [Nitrospirota bacterium]